MHKVNGDIGDRWGFGPIENGQAMKPHRIEYYDKPNFRKSKVVGSNAMGGWEPSMHLLDGSIGINNGELEVSLFYGHHGLMLRQWIPNGQLGSESAVCTKQGDHV